MNFCQSDLKYFPDETVATVTCLRLCTDKGQIWCARANPRSTLSCQISCECVHCVGFWWPKTTILGKFWLLGAPVATPFTDEDQIGVLEQAQGLHLYAKFHLNVFIVSTSGGQKKQFWANFDIWGLLYRPPFTDKSQIWWPIVDQVLYACMPKFISIGLLCRPLAAKNSNFAFFGLRQCRQLAAIWESGSWVHSCKSSPIQLRQNRFCTPTPSWRNHAHKL